MKLAAHLTACAMLALTGSTSALAAPPVSVLPVIDFKDTFPWKVWLSSEGHDAQAPSGFKLKLLSVRSSDSKTVEFVLIREIPPSEKLLMLHAKGPLAGFDDTAAKLLDIYARKFNVTFQEFDLSDVHDSAEFQTRAGELGWVPEASPK